MQDQDFQIASEVMMTTVHDRFLEAVEMRSKDVPSHRVRKHLLDRGHEIGHMKIDEVNAGNSFELIFSTGERISFDGTAYHFAPP
jgi:hypothetical protein